MSTTWGETGEETENHLLQMVCAVCSVAQSCLTLCDPMDCSPPGSSVHGMLQARILEWVAMPSSRGSSQPRDQTQSLTSPALAGMFSTTSVTWKVSHFCTHFKIRLFGFFVSEFQQNFKGLEAATSLFHLTSLWHRLS